MGELAADNAVRIAPKKRLILNKTPKNTPADLKVMSVTITPQPPRAKKDLISIKVMVRNVGGRPTPMPASLSMSVYSVDANGNRTTGDSNLNAIPWYTNNIPVLNPGESREISKTVTCNHPGPHEVSGVIITEGFAVGDEMSQNNNYKEPFAVHLPPKKADIELTTFKIDSSGRLEIKMCNRGFSVPNRDFEFSQIRVFVNDDSAKTLMFPQVDPTGIVKKGRGNGPILMGPIRHLKYKWPTSGNQGLQFTSGQSFTIKVHLNYNNSIYDKKLNNNKKTKTITAP
jgi:hypothetical protein